MRNPNKAAFVVYLVAFGMAFASGASAGIMLLFRLAKLAAAQPGSAAAREILKNEGWYATDAVIMIALGVCCLGSCIVSRVAYQAYKRAVLSMLRPVLSTETQTTMAKPLAIIVASDPNQQQPELPSSTLKR